MPPIFYINKQLGKANVCEDEKVLITIAVKQKRGKKHFKTKLRRGSWSMKYLNRKKKKRIHITVVKIFKNCKEKKSIWVGKKKSYYISKDI